MNLSDLLDRIVTNQLQCEVYKLQIIKNVIFPYIKTMKTRIILKKQRFLQIKFLINLLYQQNNEKKNGENESENDRKEDEEEEILMINHPANTLIQIENIIQSIKQERNWFQSEFEVDLEHAVQLEWKPILKESRYRLSSISFFFLC